MTAKEYVNRAFGDILSQDEKDRVVVYLIANGLAFNAENLEKAYELVKGLQHATA
jgi:hypothetical protein